MRIFRLCYLVFTLFALAILLALSITRDYIPYTGLLLVLVVLPNYFLRHADRKVTANIILKYSLNCDPDVYLSDLKKYRRRCILTKSQKYLYSLYDCLGLIDSGNFDKALDILLEIDDSKVHFDDITNILLIKSWCEYYYFQNKDVKLKASVLRLKNYITSSKNENLRNNASLIYRSLEAKYYVLSGENLDKAKKIYTDITRMAPTNLNLAKALYELAIIDIKEKNYHEGINKLKRVSDMNEKLYVVKNANELISRYNNR